MISNKRIKRLAAQAQIFKSNPFYKNKKIFKVDCSEVSCEQAIEFVNILKESIKVEETGEILFNPLYLSFNTRAGSLESFLLPIKKK